MSYQLSFTDLLNYDAGQPSITVPVTLRLSLAHVDCEAKIDTGSSYCIFSRNVGEQLGLDIESGLRLLIGTITGSFATYLHEVSLSVAAFQLTALVGFAEDERFRRNVLGRRGFLEQMTLGLVDYEGQLYLGRYGTV